MLRLSACPRLRCLESVDGKVDWYGHLGGGEMTGILGVMRICFRTRRVAQKLDTGVLKW